MNNMLLRGFFLFFATLVAWGSALWFGVRPDFRSWAPSIIVALHIGPPLAVVVMWGLWYRMRQKAKQKATQAANAQAEAERQAIRDEARRKHVEVLAERQKGCDCRGVVMTQVAQPEGAMPAFGLKGQAVEISSFEGGAAEDIELLAHLRDGISEALAALYKRSPGAAVFPLYVCPPVETSGDEVFACVSEARALAIAQNQLRERGGGEFNRCLFLPGGDSIADRVIGLFDSAPDLPGAVVLAFDSEWLRAGQTEDDSPDPDVVERRQWIGSPSQGVFALLLTHPNLEAMLEASEQFEFEPEAMTPHWDRGLQGCGHQVLLAALRPEEKVSLRQAPLLARIHRAAFARMPSGRSQALAVVRQLQGLVERAQINAALIDCPFEALPAAEPKQDDEPPVCGWLVHNAGGVGCSGNRLAALGAALYNRGVSVDPIDMATNLVVQGGDYGQACGLALLAVTVARATEERAAVLCAEFLGADGIGLFFTVPPAS